MSISRRSALLATAATLGASRLPDIRQSGFSASPHQPVYSITPVISDNVWIWDKQPEDQQGLLDSREFDVSVGVRWTSDGSAHNLGSSTVAPVAFPEQEIVSFDIRKSEGCSATVVPLNEGAGQLQVTAPVMERGQVIEVSADYRLKISRVCPRYDSSQFPHEQVVNSQMAEYALGNSPGIRSDLNAVARIARSVASRHDHPWEKARKFHAWVWENIKGVPGKYTSVAAAIKHGVGDCEERAGVFIALCRAVGIPARLVWVPNHSWAEFCLFDEQQDPHWIASHTAAYNWFGWTGVHELILQKGDRIMQPGKDSYVRLITDWYTFQGRRPRIEFTGSVVPVASGDRDPGPGQRRKNDNGGWDLVGDHPDKRRIRGD